MLEPGPEHQQKRRRRWPWLLAALILIAGGYWLATRQPAGTAGGDNPFSRRGMLGAPVPVKVASVEQGKIDFVLKAVGTVTAYNTVTVRSQVDGELVEVAFDEGQKVAKGDLLARVDPRSYQIALDQAQGALQQHQAELRNARRDLQRYQQLFKQNSIARQQVDTQSSLVQQLQGAVVSDKAAVDNAELQLSYTRITAPISGRLGLRAVDVGNIINASSTDGVVTITQIQPISVLFSLPQAQLPQVAEKMRQGVPLQVTLYDSADLKQIATGRLESIDNQINIDTGTVRLKARFDNEGELLFPNAFVNVHLRVDTLEALLVPTAAIQQGSIGAFVYVVDESSKVHIQAIETGHVENGRSSVVSGLKQGQRVVVEGVDRLREGATVDVAAAGEDSPSATPYASSAGPAQSGAAGSRADSGPNRVGQTQLSRKGGSAQGSRKPDQG